MAAIGRFHDVAFDRHATHKSRVLGDETNPNTISGRLDFNRDILEAARGKQTVYGVRDVRGAEGFTGFQGLSPGQVRRIERLRRRKLDVDDPPAFKL